MDALATIDAEIARNREWASRLYHKVRSGDLSAGPRLNRCNEAFADLMQYRCNLLGEDLAPYRIGR